MPSKQILILGTAARGGVHSVVQAYNRAGFYSEGRGRFIPSHVEGRWVQKLIVAGAAYFGVGIMLARRRVALMHLHMAMRGSFWRKALFLAMGRIAGVPVVIHLHGSEFMEFYNTSPAWVRKIIRGTFDRASTIVVLSESWRGCISSLTKAPVVVVANFVADQYNHEEAQRRRERHSVLFLGELGRRKGIYDLLRAFGGVLQSVPQATLYCGGNGDVDGVKLMVKKLGLDGAVQVLGWVSGEAKRSLLHRCSVFVLPSYNEGLPMAIIEAMSCSMAIVSTRVGGIPELVDESNGALIEPGDLERLRAEVVRLLEQEEGGLTDMGAASRRKFCSCYSAEKSLAQMRGVYVSLGVEP